VYICIYKAFEGVIYTQSSILSVDVPNVVQYKYLVILSFI